MANTVLGHFPNYLNLAAKLHDVHLFSVPNKQWANMSLNQRWSANAAFLQTAIGNGNCFCFSDHPIAARRGSYFYNEVRYLRSCNVRIVLPLNAYIAP